MLSLLLLRPAQPLARQKKNSPELSSKTKEIPPNIDVETATVPAVAPIVVPAPILKKKSLNLSAFEDDINADVKSKEKETSIHVEPVAIDENLFQECWQQYIKVLTDEGNAGMATSFSEIDCHIDFNKIILEISSASIEELIKKDKTRLIEFFRLHLKNESVEIETKIMENAIQKNIKSLSSKERLNEMISRNPDVLKLVQDLGLELDY